MRRKTDKAKSIVKKEKRKRKKKAEHRKKERTAAGQLCRPPVTYHHIKASTHIHQHHCFLKPTFRRGLPQHFSSQMGTSHCLSRYSCPSCWSDDAVTMEAFPNRNTFSLLLKSLEISIAVVLENYAVLYGPV